MFYTKKEKTQINDEFKRIDTYNATLEKRIKEIETAYNRKIEQLEAKLKSIEKEISVQNKEMLAAISATVDEKLSINKIDSVDASVVLDEYLNGKRT